MGRTAYSHYSTDVLLPRFHLFGAEDAGLKMLIASYLIWLLFYTLHEPLDQLPPRGIWEDWQCKSSFERMTASPTFSSCIISHTFSNFIASLSSVSLLSYPIINKENTPLHFAWLTLNPLSSLLLIPSVSSQKYISQDEEFGMIRYRPVCAWLMDRGRLVLLVGVAWYVW